MIEVPLLIAQGRYGPLVTASVHDQFVEQRCDAGQNAEYRTKGADHLSIMSPGSRFVADLVSWTEARPASELQEAGCRRISG